MVALHHQVSAGRLREILSKTKAFRNCLRTEKLASESFQIS
jgi:hypothetical protein